MLFGSLVKGKMKPDSDIDILIIAKLAREVNRRLKLRMETSKETRERTSFGIHIVTPEKHKKLVQQIHRQYIEI